MFRRSGEPSRTSEAARDASRQTVLRRRRVPLGSRHLPIQRTRTVSRTRTFIAVEVSEAMRGAAVSLQEALAKTGAEVK